MRYALAVAAVALAAACADSPTAPVPSKPTVSFRLSSTTYCQKEPGPTDTQITTSTNGGDQHPPGHNSTTEVSNKDCK
jgi:hypothetical protein